MVVCTFAGDYSSILHSYIYTSSTLQNSPSTTNRQGTNASSPPGFPAAVGDDHSLGRGSTPAAATISTVTTASSASATSSSTATLAARARRVLAGAVAVAVGRRAGVATALERRDHRHLARSWVALVSRAVSVLLAIPIPIPAAAVALLQDQARRGGLLLRLHVHLGAAASGGPVFSALVVSRRPLVFVRAVVVGIVAALAAGARLASAIAAVPARLLVPLLSAITALAFPFLLHTLLLALYGAIVLAALPLSRVAVSTAGALAPILALASTATGPAATGGVPARLGVLFRIVAIGVTILRTTARCFTVVFLLTRLVVVAAAALGILVANSVSGARVAIAAFGSA